MKEIITLFLIYFLFFTASFFYAKKIVVVKLLWLLISLPIYIAAIFLYFDLLVSAHRYLRDNGIYFEFGHADEELIELFLFCFLSAVAFIIWILIKRYLVKR